MSMPGLDLTKISSNWKQLQGQLQSEKKSNGNLKRKRLDNIDISSRTRPVKRYNARKMGSLMSTQSEPVVSAGSHADLQNRFDISNNDLSVAYGSFHELSAEDKINDGRHTTHKAGKYLALDCEMVGTGPPPHSDDVLARVSIVNFHGQQVYDSYVLPPPGVKIQDFRTHVSGIREEHMRIARPYAEVQKDVIDLLDGKILVGHALRKDMLVLNLSHQPRDVRDTSRHAAFRVESRGKAPALRNLVKLHLGATIQSGAHSSLEDARATMLLYKKDKSAFELESRRLYGMPRKLPEKRASIVVDHSEDDEEEVDDDDDGDEDELLDGEDDEFTGVTTTTSKKPRKKRKKKSRTRRA